MTPEQCRPPYREPVRTLTPRLFDVLLAGFVVAVGIAEIWVPFESRQGGGSAVTCTLGVVVSGLALTQRRNHPFGAGVAVILVPPVMWLVSPTYVLFFGQFLPMAVAVFSLARHGRGRVPFYGAAVAAATLVLVDLTVDLLQAPGELVFHWGVFTVVWGFGYGLSQFEQRARESTERAVAAEVAAAERAMAAVIEERTRIARELHDIVAHSVSMMVVQAGAAEQAVDDDPEFVRRALATVRSTGAGALAEMRRVVAMLRDDDEPGALAPQPGLAALPGLVEETRRGSLAVTLDVTGDRTDLPAGVDLAAYRIVQEALTNVRRHASATTVRIAVTYTDQDVTVEVVDDGTGQDGAGAAGTGHGLVGMRERAGLYGGRVETGTGSEGQGFSVRAVLPVAAAGETVP
jgi:signal transduction histidine kinase